MECNSSIMRVDETTAQTRRNKYLADKQPLLTSLIGKQEETAILVSLQGIQQLFTAFFSISSITGVRAYLATYPELPSTDFPAGKEKMLTIIFKPTKKDAASNKHVDIPGNNFWLHPTTGLHNLSNATADKWISNYIDIKHTRLSLLIGKAETKSIWYNQYSLKSFKDDIQCYFDNNVAISDIFITFGSYKDEETVYDSETTSNIEVGKQLTLVIVITEPAAAFYNKPIFKFGNVSQDTGIPCPPAKCP